MEQIKIIIVGEVKRGREAIANEVQKFCEALGLTVERDGGAVPEMSVAERTAIISRYRPGVLVETKAGRPTPRKDIFYRTVERLARYRRLDDQEKGKELLEQVASDQIDGVGYLAFFQECKDRGMDTFMVECQKYHKPSEQHHDSAIPHVRTHRTGSAGLAGARVW